jgi:hypothetical protein
LRHDRARDKAISADKTVEIADWAAVLVWSAAVDRGQEFKRLLKRARYVLAIQRQPSSALKRFDALIGDDASIPKHASLRTGDTD